MQNTTLEAERLRRVLSVIQKEALEHDDQLKRAQVETFGANQALASSLQSALDSMLQSDLARLSQGFAQVDGATVTARSLSPARPLQFY